ncbi:MAG: malT [Actinobacteria bacterium]|nr:malT [Actinomycetota bacterium]
MRSSPPIAKVTRPVPVGYFPRRRLYNLLDKSRKVPVLWITGPPGCGKTALVSSYIESRRLPCLWYKVDDADADIGTFFYYLGLAAGKAAPRKKKPLPLLTPDRLPGLSVFAKRYFEDLSARLPVPSLLVLDDCHRLQDDSPFFEMLREGVSRLTPGIGVVVISRKDPHPSFARDRANRLMETLGWKDLRLTIEEVAGIARVQRKGRSSSELVRYLFERTDGWAAGLVLLLYRKDKKSVEPRTIGQQVPAEIFDYFGSEIYRQLEEENKVFLLRSAFLPKMTVSMAASLTGIVRAGQILSDMNRHNYFTDKHLQREPVYEYHALFREYLLEQGRGVFSDEERARIGKDAATLLEESGYVEDAARLFRRAGDWEALARVILSQARSLFMQGRNQTLLEWLAALPREILHSEPWLLYWNGVGLLTSALAESQACFEEAFWKFEKRNDVPGVFLAWAGVVDSIITGMEGYRPLDAWIPLLPPLLERHGSLLPSEIEDQVTCSMFKAISFRQFPRDDVALWTARALAMARKSTDLRLKVETAAIYFYCHHVGRGGYQDAEISLASLKEELKRPDATPWMWLWVFWMEATLSLCLAMPARCLRVVSDGLAFAETTGVHVIDTMLFEYGALAALELGDLETANRYIGKVAASSGRMGPLLSRIFQAIMGCEALQRGDPGKAAFHAKESQRLAEEAGDIIEAPTGHLLAAHAHHALREDEEASRHLAQARRIGSDIESPYVSWLSDLAEAYFHLDRNDEAAAVALLRKGLKTGRENGFLGGLFPAFSLRPGFIEKVAVMAFEEGIEVEYVRDLIRQHRIVPDSANPDVGQWPWPVKVYTLGRFGLLADDRPVEFGRKVQQRPLSLLKALIALGGRDVSEARLTELLWPEADGDLAHHSFTVALSRLRKLLRKEEALVLKEGRLSLSNRHCWVDVWAFERFLGQAEKARKEGKGTEAIRHFEKTLSLCRGPFLAFEELPWAVSLREKLRGGFLGAVTHLGRCYEEAGRWEEAVACYGKGLDADDLAEELYRRLMVCHLKQGQEAKALSVFRRCRNTLSSVLGVDPSAETRAIVASLGRSPA